MRNISARHNVLLDTIGPREEEVECYERALWYFWTVIITFLVCSLLELILHLLYSYKVSSNDKDSSKLCKKPEVNSTYNTVLFNPRMTF